MKKFLSILLIILIIISSTCSVYAATNTSNTINPLWTNIASADLSMDFISNGTQGLVNTYVEGPSNTEKIVTSIIVYKKNLLTWSKIATYGESTTYNHEQYRAVYFPAEEGETYKAVFTYTVTVNGVSETDSSTVKGTNN